MSTKELDDRIARLPAEKRALLELRLLRDRRSAAPPAISRRAAGADLTLSFAQQRLWFLDRLEPGTPLYNIPEAFRLEGPLNSKALEKALEEIVRRHEVLRTAFPAVDGNPAPAVSAPPAPVLDALDLSGLSEKEREEELARIAREEWARAFDLSRGPLFRARLVMLSAEDHVLFLAMHHIVSDGWSVDVLIGELSALYAAFAEGRPSPLPELPIQYLDYAAWQRGYLTEDVLQGDLSYWRRELAGELPVLNLPSDRARPAARTYRGGERRIEFSEGLTEGLSALSRGEGATLFMTLLAAFCVLLCRDAGQEEVLVGTPIAGRNRRETEGLIGFFVNTLVLRGDLTGNPSFRELLARVRDKALEAYAHQDLPFERLVTELRPERSLSHTPLFGVMFAFENTPPAQLSLPDLRVIPLEAPNRTSKFDLTLSARVSGEKLTASLEYSSDLFEPTTVERMLSRFGVLLEGIVSNPDMPVSRLPLLTEAERRQLLVLWNDTSAEYPRETLLHQPFQEWVEKSPEAVAVEFGQERLTYRDLNARANRVARRLRAMGVGPEAIVGICMERSLDMVVGLLGTLKAGGAYLPLDPDSPKERLSFMLDDAGARLTLTQRRLLDSLPPEKSPIFCLDAEAKSLGREGSEDLEERASPGNLAYVLYTSGSTGKPKGAMITHGAISNHMHWMRETFPLSAEDRVLQKTPISFDASVWEFYAPLFAGARLVLGGPDAHRDASELLRLIESRRITVLQVVPPLLRMLLEVPGLERCGSLERVFCGGGPLTHDLQERFFSRSRAELINLYGPTEATIDATFWRCRRDGPAEVVPIGRPIANTRAYVLDRDGQPAPPGIPGELYLGGAGIARGYLNRPELTAEKFAADPFGPRAGARLYRTGDRARYRPDGEIEFLGRFDDQVKIRGFRVELGEIEAVLTAHPGIRETVVAVREDTPGDKRLVAYLVADWKPEPAFSELRKFLAERLPEYMLPSAFVTLRAFPLLPSGKVDRRALPEPDRTRPELERRYVAPKDELEMQLTKIWEKVLGVRPVGSRDNFFDLGGHSLLAVRLFTQIEKAIGRKLPLATLFRAPTVGQLAGALREEGWSAPWSSLVPIQPGGSRTPFYCVHAAGGNVLTYRDLAKYLGADQPVYGLQAIGLDGTRPPHDRIEDMAAHYLKEMRALQPEGPYFLGGTSAGGLVAFEIARQLHALGQNVGVLALFDTWGPDYGKLLPNATRLRLKLYGIVERFDLHLGNLLVGGARAKWSYIREKSKRWKSRVRRSLRRMNFPLPSALRDVESATRWAILSYVPDVYPGRVTLFRATKQPAGYYADPNLGWSRVAAGGVEIYDVPGRHGAIVYEPRIRILAEQLRLCLASARVSRAASGSAGSADGAVSTSDSSSTSAALRMLPFFSCAGALRIVMETFGSGGC